MLGSAIGKERGLGHDTESAIPVAKIESTIIIPPITNPLLSPQVQHNRSKIVTETHSTKATKMMATTLASLLPTTQTPTSKDSPGALAKTTTTSRALHIPKPLLDDRERKTFFNVVLVCFEFSLVAMYAKNNNNKGRWSCGFVDAFVLPV